MTVLAMILLTPAQATAAENLNTYSVRVDCREIDNPLANQLGEGTLVGLSILPARLLNDPMYVAWYSMCSVLPIRTLDSDILFLPPPPLD